MYFTGSLSSITESVLPPNATDELSNEFLDSVGIIFEKYLCSYRKFITVSFRIPSYGISVCIIIIKYLQ